MGTKALFICIFMLFVVFLQAVNCKEKKEALIEAKGQSKSNSELSAVDRQTRALNIKELVKGIILSILAVAIQLVHWAIETSKNILRSVVSPVIGAVEMILPKKQILKRVLNRVIEGPSTEEHDEEIQLDLTAVRYFRGTAVREGFLLGLDHFLHYGDWLFNQDQDERYGSKIVGLNFREKVSLLALGLPLIFKVWWSSLHENYFFGSKVQLVGKQAHDKNPPPPMSIHPTPYFAKTLSGVDTLRSILTAIF